MEFLGVYDKTCLETLKKKFTYAMKLLFYPSIERIHLRALK